MGLATAGAKLVERVTFPDALLRAGIRRVIAASERKFRGFTRNEERDFAGTMIARPIAEFAQAANDQHYELPPEFFALCLGPRRKYSSCLYPTGKETLVQAELCALEETVMHAALEDGQNVLELGCGWGSLSLHMAERFSNSRITAISNSASQRLYIEQQAAKRGISNLRVLTTDMNDFLPAETYDRIVSVEMFEHMANWPNLFARLRQWLKPEGCVFIHVFAHENACYRYERGDDADWIAQHFFTGGIMPSRNLIRECARDFAVESEWRWSGLEYKRTALHWLANFDRNRPAIDEILANVYGAENVALWRRRWRMFFLATAEMFGYAKGRLWGVSHYRLKPL